jgi:tetratricopeptide (TPR) repeat protein
MVVSAFLLTVCGCAGASDENRQRSEREYELAVSLYRDEHNAQSALVTLERSLQLDPANAEAHLLMGNLFGEAELYHRAEPHLRRAVELFAHEAEDDPEKLARLGEARNALAAALVNLNRPAEAVTVLQQVVGDVHYPSQHLALANLGQAYVALHRYPEAVAVLERAVGARPDFCVGFFRLGDAYLRMDDYGHALAALDHALSNNAPGCSRIQPALRDRGEVHARLHQPDAAREDFARCRDLNPSTRDGRDCAAQLRTSESPPP